MKRGRGMKIQNVEATDDYMLIIDFEDGSRIQLNMQKKLKSIPFMEVRDLERFKTVKFQERAVYWDSDQKPEYRPLRLTVDDILFSLR
jgi:hypothetical protein